MSTTQRDHEYKKYCRYKIAVGDDPVGREAFDLLWWLYSDCRADWIAGRIKEGPVPARGSPKAIMSARECKNLRHYTSEERKAMPVHSGVMMYFPDALAAVARVSKAGNDKHNPGEPLHWARGKSTDQMDCAARHMLTPQAIDPDSGEAELVHALWRLMAQVQLNEEKRLVAAGIMPLSGVTE